MNTYWNNNGKYQELYDKIKGLVPAMGKADRIHVELLRNVSKLYHDFYNNGLGNLDVLYTVHWYNLFFARDKYLGGEFTLDDLSMVEDIFDDWFVAYEDHWEEGLSYEDLVALGLDELLEKLSNAVILFAAEKEGLV